MIDDGQPRASIKSMTVVLVDSYIGVIHVKYLCMLPISQTLHSLALLWLDLEDNFDPLGLMFYENPTVFENFSCYKLVVYTLQ